jgi:hypothetical protein
MQELTATRAAREAIWAAEGYEAYAQASNWVFREADFLFHNIWPL